MEINHKKEQQIGMREHTCTPDLTCTCSMIAMEPDEKCPTHGVPPRYYCRQCGRIARLRWDKKK